MLYGHIRCWWKITGAIYIPIELIEYNLDLKVNDYDYACRCEKLIDARNHIMLLE